MGQVHLAIQRRGAGVGQPRRLVDEGLADFEQDIVHATVVRLDLEWPRRFDALLRHVDDGGEDVRLGLVAVEVESGVPRVCQQQGRGSDEAQRRSCVQHSQTRMPWHAVGVTCDEANCLTIGMNARVSARAVHKLYSE